MRFTEQEIVFLLSVSRGRAPFGLEYHLPEKEERKAYIENTISSLVKKRILDEDRRLTEEGAYIIQFFEKYRNSKKHIRLNYVNAAVLPGNALITMIKTENGYEAGCIRSELFMTELLKQMDFLCLHKECNERGKWQDIGEEEWQKELEDMEGGIILSEYYTGKLESEKVYFWKNGIGYQFHKTNKRIRALSPQAMRKQLYRALKEEEADGKGI